MKFKSGEVVIIMLWVCSSNRERIFKKEERSTGVSLVLIINFAVAVNTRPRFSRYFSKRRCVSLAGRPVNVRQREARARSDSHLELILVRCCFRLVVPDLVEKPTVRRHRNLADCLLQTPYVHALAVRRFNHLKLKGGDRKGRTRNLHSCHSACRECRRIPPIAPL